MTYFHRHRVLDVPINTLLRTTGTDKFIPIVMFLHTWPWRCHRAERHCVHRWIGTDGPDSDASSDDGLTRVPLLSYSLVVGKWKYVFIYRQGVQEPDMCHFVDQTHSRVISYSQK